MTLEWDATEYEALSGPQTGWGANLLGLFLERQLLRGDEAVIDAGCGTGRVTELLLRHIPDGTVLAVDASKAMVEAAGRRFAGDPRVRVERQDLLRLEVGDPVDLIFSTATLHWIKDHERLFDQLARALKPGGRLVAQCGGKGNIARVTSATEEVMREKRFRDYFEGWEDPKEYADAETTRVRLEAAGFEQVETWLHEEPTYIWFCRRASPLLQSRRSRTAPVTVAGGRARALRRRGGCEGGVCGGSTRHGLRSFEHSGDPFESGRDIIGAR